MKRVLTMLLLLPMPLLAVNCPKGTEPYKDGCVYMLVPYLAQPVKPSDEKPPSDKMPSYQREGVTIANAPNTLAEDEKMDREKADALRGSGISPKSVHVW